ncbi:TRM13, partial [Symbiodinium microadriaticum]
YSDELRSRLLACARAPGDPLAFQHRYARPADVQGLLQCVASVALGASNGLQDAGHLGPTRWRVAQLSWGRYVRYVPIHPSKGRTSKPVLRIAEWSRGSRRPWRIQSRSSTSDRKGSPLPFDCKSAMREPLLIVLSVTSPYPDSPAKRQMLKDLWSCATLLTALGPSRATAEVRRQIAQQKWKWTELARFEGRQATWSRSDVPVTGWSLLWRSEEPTLRGPELYCQYQDHLQPALTLHFLQSPCEKCCVGSAKAAKEVTTGRAGEEIKLEEGTWRCGQENPACIADFRRLLSCQKVREEDMGSVDWLSLREQMRRALVYAREGLVEGFRDGLHGQLHKIAFEAQFGDFMLLDMGRKDWVRRFRDLYSLHLTDSKKEVFGPAVRREESDERTGSTALLQATPRAAFLRSYKCSTDFSAARHYMNMSPGFGTTTRPPKFETQSMLRQTSGVLQDMVKASLLLKRCVGKHAIHEIETLEAGSAMDEPRGDLFVKAGVRDTLMEGDFPWAGILASGWQIRGKEAKAQAMLVNPSGAWKAWINRLMVLLEDEATGYEAEEFGVQLVQFELRSGWEFRAVPMALRRLLALGPVPSAERVRGQEPFGLLASTPQ